MDKKNNMLMVLAILALVTVGYLPVLVGDFVPQDQWRAFTYGANVDGIEKWTACVKGRFDFFILIGRPLVWVSECIEHGLIHDITDFKFLRLPALSIVLSTMLICGTVFRGLVDSFWKGTLLAVPIVFSPGYAYMVYQGQTESGVLASVAFALASVYFSFNYIDETASYKCRRKILEGLFSGVFFLLALFNYPSFAFVAFGAIFFRVAYAPDIDLAKRGKILASMFLYFGLICAVYYLSVRILSHFVEFQDVRPRQLSVVELREALNKVQKTFEVLFHAGAFVNLSGIPYIGWAAVLGASLFVPACTSGKPLTARLLPMISFLTLFPAVAVLGSAPVILSHFEGFPTRLVFPGNFMIGFAAFVVLIKSSEKFSSHIHSTIAMPLTLIVALSVFVVQQVRISVSLVQDSTIEVFAIRAAVDTLHKQGGWSAGKHVHVLRANPVSFSQNFIWFNSEEYLPASTQNPAHIKEMFTMALRERLSEEDLRWIHIRDCRLNLECGILPPKAYEIVLTQGHENKSMAPWSKFPEIIDLSNLDVGGVRP